MKMATAEQYQRQLKDLGLDRTQISIENAAQAKAALATIRTKQGQLRQIKRDINQDMKTIRATYQNKIAAAGEGSAAMMGLFGKRGAGGHLRADAKRRMRGERDRALQPYANLKLAIDDLLVQMDGAKVKLGSIIEEEKQETRANKEATKAAKPATGMFCPECGKQVDEADKFCRLCGNRM